MALYNLFPDARRYSTVSPQETPVAGHRIVFGLVLGQGEFHGCVAIMDATVYQLVKICRFVNIDYGIYREKLLRLSEIWKPATIWADASETKGPTIEALQGAGLPAYPLNLTTVLKERLLQDLALGLVDEWISLVPDEELIAELQAYHFDSNDRKASSALPPNMTGDSVIATALSLYGSASGGVSIRFA